MPRTPPWMRRASSPDASHRRSRVSSHTLCPNRSYSSWSRVTPPTLSARLPPPWPRDAVVHRPFAACSNRCSPSVRRRAGQTGSGLLGQGVEEVPRPFGDRVGGETQLGHDHVAGGGRTEAVDADHVVGPPLP